MAGKRDISFWKGTGRVGAFQTGVCLHGHTFHSEECLSFLPAYLHRVPGVSQIVAGYQRGGVDFSRAFWTPPHTPAAAFQLERSEIVKLGLRPLVSLTDHDNIQAGVELQAAGFEDEAPVSVEWTVPYCRSIFHLGIHNLPASSAGTWMSQMAGYTAVPQEKMLPGVLSGLSAIPDVLTVLNHPFWLEEGVDDADHRRALPLLLHECSGWLHAFELNGTRPWPENAEAEQLGAAYSKPVISGGDRHAGEPSACLNLTNAATFSEFVVEVRDGASSVVFLPHYRQPMGLRILEASCDVLRSYPEYPERRRWTDRVFYRNTDGIARPLSKLWGGREPWLLRPATGTLRLLATAGVRGALRAFLSPLAEALP